MSYNLMQKLKDFSLLNIYIDKKKVYAVTLARL